MRETEMKLLARIRKEIKGAWRPRHSERLASASCRADGSGVRIEVDLRTLPPLAFGSRIGAIPMVVTGTHDPYLVVLSILVASFASYTALDLAAHVGATRGLARRLWLVAGAHTHGR